MGEQLKSSQRGIRKVETLGTVYGGAKNGIKVLTVYAFSTENWKRDEKEVNF